MAANLFLTAGLVVALATAVVALKCYQCGQYNDGVGSITPCTNHTHMALKECPQKDASCIKYQSEGSLVRDCVGQCTEKESWNARTFCCNNMDGCNSSSALEFGLVLLLCAGFFALAH